MRPFELLPLELFRERDMDPEVNLPGTLDAAPELAPWLGYGDRELLNDDELCPVSAPDACVGAPK